MLALLGLLLAAAPSPAALREAGQPGLAAIHGAALSAHVRFLSDELLEGRGTGTRGHALAARYVASQLEALGYEPAGERGTWFQRVPLVGMKVVPERSRLAVDGADLRYGEDFVVAPRAGTAEDEVSGELVFAGFGIAAPQYGYEDAPADLRGKIAVVLYGAPRSDRMDFFPPAASAVYSDGETKAKLLAARGAVGMIVVATPEAEKQFPWKLYVEHSRFERMAWMEGDRPGAGYALPVAVVSTSTLPRLLEGTGQRPADLFARATPGKLQPFPLGKRGSLRVSCDLRNFASENVAAVLRGAARPREHVVVSAHLDHLGLGPASEGYPVYTGAVDNASGVAAVLEVARALAALPRRPARSILVVAVTGEEEGLLGAEYFARHPTVPGALVADVNLDSIFAAWRPHDVVALGAEHSTLGDIAQAAAAALHLRLSPDPDPEQVDFIRSDQYAFVKAGIPSLFPFAGYQDASGATEKNRAWVEAWFASQYHRPSDRWDPALDYENMAITTRAAFLMTLAIANDPDRPRWRPGDVLGKLFAPGR